MARLTFLGLDMSDTTEVGIIEAIRGLYPDLVDPGISDDRAVQLVLKHIIKEHLKTWAARTAIAGTPDSIAQTARDQAIAAQVAAAASAGTSADTDIQPTTLT